MDAEIEVVDGEFVEVEVRRPRPRAIDRVRAVAASPRVQGAATATAGLVVGAATMALMKRFGAEPAAPSAGRSPAPAPDPFRRLPIQPGTYLVTIRPLPVRPYTPPQ